MQRANMYELRARKLVNLSVFDILYIYIYINYTICISIPNSRCEIIFQKQSSKIYLK